MKVKLLKVIRVHFQEGGVDVDGPGSAAVGTGEADRGLRYCIILVCLASAGASSHFVLHRTESHNSEIFSHITSRW
jgi:hypothetical protein